MDFVKFGRIFVKDPKSGFERIFLRKVPKMPLSPTFRSMLKKGIWKFFKSLKNDTRKFGFLLGKTVFRTSFFRKFAWNWVIFKLDFGHFKTG